MTNGGDDNPFWKWSLSVYARPGLREALLEWQDEWNGDVNLALFCCWMGEQGRSLGQDDLVQLTHMLAPWNAKTIRPLRRLRKMLRAAGAGQVREAVKTAELEAERHAQDLLFGASQTLTAPSGGGATAANLHQAAVQLVDPPPKALTDLAVRIVAAF